MTYKQIYDMAKTHTITIVDVRTKEEYEEGHVPHAILCDVQTFMQHAPSLFKDKEKQYVLYCRTGYRSQIAAMQMQMLGYKNIIDMGGIIDWPFELET